MSGNKRQKKPSILERLRAKKRRADMPMVGIVWYSETTWQSIKSTATDPDRLEPTFHEWVVMAEKALIEFKKTGMFPVKVLIDPPDFLSWCTLHQKENNAAARAEFVSAKATDQGNSSA